MLRDVEDTVAGRLRSNVGATPKSALAGEDTLLLGAQALVLAKEVTIQNPANNVSNMGLSRI